MEFLTSQKVKEYGGQPITVAQSKFDGYYAEVYKSETGIVICTKGQKTNIWYKLKKNPVIKMQIDSLPWNTILRCELHAFNISATSVPTLVNEANCKLLLSPFRIEIWSGLISRYSFEEERKLFLDHDFIVPQVKVFSNSNDPISLDPLVVEELKELARAAGFEGWVLKDTPRGGMWKIKPQKTVDAFVVGYKISDSDTYAGGLKSVDIAVYGTATKKQIIIATVGTGFEGDYRYSVDLKTLIGRVGEFKYQSLGAKGRLKFPRFLRWRDDEKLATECTTDQLKGFSSC